MCGIAAVSKSSSSNIGSTTYVFLYFTEAEITDSEHVTQGKDPLGNRLYRYELVNISNNNTKLINSVLLLDLPAIPGPRHNGGAIMIGPDNNLYIPIGDIDGWANGKAFETKAQNYVNGIEPDGRAGILRITQDGKPVGDSSSGSGGATGSSSSNGSILGDTHPLNLYYAYGIRNSFGFDFDPVSGNIWDTENGPGDGPGEGDEINLVEPGFNSGWQEVHGMASIAADNNNNFNPTDDLVNFEGKGKYSDPEFAWIETVGPTALKFLNSHSKLGMQYVNDMFVGDVHNGWIYHFDLNEARTELILGGGLLADKVADTDSELESSADDNGNGGGIIFGKGFGGITDLDVGPDGYLYVVSIGQGAIYRIVPSQ